MSCISDTARTQRDWTGLGERISGTHGLLHTGPQNQSWGQTSTMVRPAQQWEAMGKQAVGTQKLLKQT